MIEITEVQRLTIKPGDRIIVKIDSPHLTDADAITIREKLRATLHIDETTPIAILTPQIELVIADGFPDRGTAKAAD